MDHRSTSQALDPLRLSRRVPKTDYKEKLRREAPEFSLGEGDNVAVLEHDASYARQVQALARHADAEGLAFQCVTSAALHTLDRILYHERRVAEAAISLAQQEKMHGMVDTITATTEALRAALTPQGQRTLCQQAPDHHAPDVPEHSWWFALSETLHALEEGSTWMRSVAAGQPRGGAAHTLSSIIVRLLHAHHRDVLAEAEHWMS